MNKVTVKKAVLGNCLNWSIFKVDDEASYAEVTLRLINIGNVTPLISMLVSETLPGYSFNGDLILPIQELAEGPSEIVVKLLMMPKEHLILNILLDSEKKATNKDIAISSRLEVLTVYP